MLCTCTNDVSQRLKLMLGVLENLLAVSVTMFFIPKSIVINYNGGIWNIFLKNILLGNKERLNSLFRDFRFLSWNNIDGCKKIFWIVFLRSFSADPEEGSYSHLIFEIIFFEIEEEFMFIFEELRLRTQRKFFYINFWNQPR